MRNKLAQELAENLNKRKAEINAELASVAVSDEVLTLQQREADLATITTVLNNTETSIKSMYSFFSFFSPFLFQKDPQQSNYKP